METRTEESATVSQYDKICRICLTDADGLQYIFSPISDDNTCTYAELISYASTVEIVETDTLPMKVCPDCLERTLSAYEFRQQVEHSEAILKDCGSSDSVIILVSEDSSKSIINSGQPLDLLKESPLEESIKDEKDDSNINENHLMIIEKSAVEKCDVDQVSMNDSKLEANESNKSNEELNLSGSVMIDQIQKRSDYDCTMCSDSFDSVHQLKKHTQTHPKGSRHYCRICFRSYARASIMKRHFFTHNGVKDHRCKFCGKAFFYLHALRAHIMFHKKNFACKFCIKRFAFKQNLIEHLKTFHLNEFSGDVNDVVVHDIQEEPESVLDQIDNDKKQQFDCSMCNKTFINMKDLIQHKKMHPIGMKHTCRVCSKTYTQAASLHRHLITHSTLKPYLCPLCGKAYSLRNSLKSHMLYHKDKILKCEHCQKKFHTNYDIREHIRVSHSDERYNFMCELCGKLCTSGSRLAVHRESHSSFCCPHCAKTYRNLYILKMHIKKHNDDPKPKNVYTCDYCGTKRALKIFIERHISKKHLKEQSFKCSECNKAFFDKNGLKQHTNVHSKHSHQCDVCGRRLTSKRSLKLHQNLHTGHRPFSCEICAKGFASASAKHVHQKRWHIDGKYQCKMCSEKFRYASDLYKHMPIHTSRIKIQSILSKIV